MPSDLSADKIIITDENWEGHVVGMVGGRARGRGYVPPTPDWKATGFRAVNFPLIPREQWPELIREKEMNKSRLSDLRMVANYGNHIPAYDQGNRGYCWAHSVTMGVQLAMAVANMPYVRLSAYSVACVIKNFRDEGAWGALALDFISERGIIPMALWPEQSVARSLNNDANWEVAKAYRVTESWQDMSVSVWDRNMTFDQVATLVLMNQPVVVEYNWWAHSVLGIDLVHLTDRYPPTDLRCYGLRILNSWSDRHGTLGTEVLTGNKMIPDGSVAPRVSVGN